VTEKNQPLSSERQGYELQAWYMEYDYPASQTCTVTSKVKVTKPPWVAV